MEGGRARGGEKNMLAAVVQSVSYIRCWPVAGPTPRPASPSSSLLLPVEPEQQGRLCWLFGSCFRKHVKQGATCSLVDSDVAV